MTSADKNADTKAGVEKTCAELAEPLADKKLFGALDPVPGVVVQ